MSFRKNVDDDDPIIITKSNVMSTNEQVIQSLGSEIIHIKLSKIILQTLKNTEKKIGSDYHLCC